MYIDPFSPQENKDVPVNIDVFATEMRLATIVKQFGKDIFKNTADFSDLINSGKEPTLKIIGAKIVRAIRAIATELSVPTNPDGDQPELAEHIEKRVIQMEFRPTELFSKELIEALSKSEVPGETIISMIPAISAALKISGCFSSVDVYTDRVEYSSNAMSVFQTTPLYIHVKMKR